MDENLKFYRNTWERFPYCLSVYDREGRTVYANPAFTEAFPDGLAGEYARLHLVPEALEENTALAAFRTRENPPGAETAPGFSAAGTVLVCVSPSFAPDGSPVWIESLIPASPETPLPGPGRFGPEEASDMMIADAAMASIVETVSRISQFDSTILISGESGTGKTMLASYIHRKSRRAEGPFITINCATIPETLIESELFGYVSGAFTGAHQKGKPGLVELAHGGTLFLDEIGLLPLPLQTKFLQLLQEKTYTPIGAVKSRTVDIRIISATNLDLSHQVARNLFREDLYYRLRVIEFSMPPLRRRPDAIDPLIDTFLEQLFQKYHLKKTISRQARERLRQYSWPGNIRELQYVLERLVVTTPGHQISTGDLPPLSEPSGGDSPDSETAPPLPALSFDEETARFEKQLLQRTFARCRSSYKVAAALGISQTKASRLLRKHGISRR